MKSLNLIVSTLYLLPRNLAVLIMLLYRILISPLYGSVCKYYPSCSKYALDNFTYRGFLVGVGLSLWRLIRCNPWSNGGVDEVKIKISSRFRVTRQGFVLVNCRLENQPV